MRVQSFFIYILCGVLMVTGGCFGGDAEEPTAEATPVVETPVAAQAPTESPAESPTATTAASEPPAEQPQTEVVAAPGAAGAAQTVEDASAILSYRVYISTTSVSARGLDLVAIEAAYVKEPPAEQILINFEQGSQSQEMELALVEGTRYMRSGDVWMVTPESAIQIDELTLITPKSVAGLVGQLETIGVETVRDRPALHVRGGKETIPVVGTEGDTLDASQLETAQIDLWIDQEFNVVSKLLMEGGNSGDAPAHFSVLFEYYDFNSEITITPPATSPAVEAPAGGEAAADPLRNELAQLLGYNLLLPVDSTLETVVAGSLVVVVTPFTVAEAGPFLEQSLQSNGYTLLTKAEPMPSQILYLFQQGTKSISITVSDNGDGRAKIQFAGAPS